MNAEEFAVLKRPAELRDIVVRVDDFPYDFDVAAVTKRDVAASLEMVKV